MEETTSIEIKYYTTVALGLVLPPVLLNIALEQFPLFVLLMVTTALGVPLGFILFEHPRAIVISCMPTDSQSQVSHDANPADIQKAA